MNTDPRWTSPASESTPSIQRSVLFSVAERYSSSVIGFGASMVIARLLSPAEVGVFTVATAVLAIVQSFRDLGATQYIIQERDLTRRRYAAAVAFTAIASTVLAALLVIGARPVATFYGHAGIAPLLYLLALGLLLTPLIAPASGLIQRSMDFPFLCWIGIAGAMASATVSVGLAWLGFSFLSLAWGSLAAGLASLGVLLAVRRRDFWTSPDLKEWRRILPFGTHLTGASLVITLGMQATHLIIPRFLDFTAVGLYGRAQGLVALLSRDVGASVYRVLVPAFAHAHRNSEDVRRLYLKSVTYMTGVAWPLYGFIGIAAHLIIETLFGSAWIGAAPVAQVLCIAGGISATWFTSTQVILALGQVNRILTVEVVVQPTRILMTLIAAPHGLLAVAAAQIATTMMGGVLFLTQLRALFDLRVGDMINATRSSAALALFACLPTFLMQRLTSDLTPHVSAPLLAVLLTFGASSVAGLWITKHPLGVDLMRGMRKLLTLSRRVSSR